MTRKRLAIYLMAGRDAPELAAAAADGGADLIEIGFPFSDPLADGPVIREAARRALAQGMRTAACLECLAEAASRAAVPVVAMTYASILEAYGYERFAADVRAAGGASLIVPDLPVDAVPDVRRVQLVAVNTPVERIRLAAANTDGWLYLVSVIGSTGIRTTASPRLAGLVKRTRAATAMPLLVGFGISTAEQAARAAVLADGVVVGTRALEVADASGAAGLRQFVSSLRSSLDALEQHTNPDMKAAR